MGILYALFDEKRRHEISDGIRTGKLRLFHNKPAPDASGERQEVKQVPLLLGQRMEIGGTAFRFLGTENDTAIVAIETQGNERIIRTKTGEKSNVMLMEGGPYSTVFIVPRENPDKFMIGVTLELAAVEVRKI